MSLKYPEAEKRPFSYECAGHTLQDPYAWMEKNDADTHAFVALQNAFTDEWFAARGDVAQRARALAGKAEKPAYSDVVECHGKLYACRTAPDGARAAVVLDLQFNEVKTLMDEAKSGGNFKVYSVKPCPGNEDVVALFVEKNGSARPSVLLQKVGSGAVFASMDGIFSFTWDCEGRRLYYSDGTADAEAGVNRNVVRAYDLATGETEVVYTEKDNAVFIMLEAAPNGDVFIHVNLSYVQVRVLRYHPATGEVAKLTPNDACIWHFVGSVDGADYFFTDAGAPRGRVVAAKPGQPLAEAADILPEDARVLAGAVAVGGRLLAVYLNDAAYVAERYDAAGKKLGDVLLPDPIGTIDFWPERPPTFTPGAKSLYLNFESFTCPPSTLRFTPGTGAVEIAYSQRDSGLRADIEVARRPVTARDGTRLLAFLVHKKGQPKSGAVPTLMYGYGGYNATLTPCYTAPFMGQDVVDWVDRGGLFVQCIIRGGGEFGAAWHEAGYRQNKKNAFCDFIDITEWLIAEGWTRPGRIAINGGSNGGLLVTALVTMRPDLFGAVVASVPHTDMIRFAWDDRGPMYTTEYGDPRDAEMFDYMLSYSPYHNIRDGVAYPPVYVQTGEFDNNVPPYHGKKFAAKMQQAGGENPCLLRVLARGSHGLGSGQPYYNTCAEMQLFVEHALGMDQ